MDFKRKGLKHLICSPIGCVRDRMDLTHFVTNILRFQRITRATVMVVSSFQESFKALPYGLTHKEFLGRLRKLLVGTSKPVTSSPHSMSASSSDLQTTQIDNPASSTTTPTVKLPGRDQTVPSVKLTQGETVKTVPGDLTFSEALKQSNSGSNARAISSPISVYKNKNNIVLAVNLLVRVLVLITYWKLALF